MSVIRVGSTSKYAEGWDTIFGGGKGGGGKTAKKAAGTKAVKAKASRAVKKKAATKARKPGKSRRG